MMTMKSANGLGILFILIGHLRDQINAFTLYNDNNNSCSTTITDVDMMDIKIICVDVR